jgi:hypothetical protein
LRIGKQPFERPLAVTAIEREEDLEGLLGSVRIRDQLAQGAHRAAPLDRR